MEGNNILETTRVISTQILLHKHWVLFNIERYMYKRFDEAEQDGRE